MDVANIVGHVKDAVTVKRVFGDPIEKDGVIVITVAVVFGGGGGGEGGDSNHGSGGGGGFAVHARPAGVYVIRGDNVRWEPALDLTAVILGGQKIVLLFIKLLLRSRRRRARKKH